MEFTQINPETIWSIGITLAVSFAAHKVSIGQIMAKTGEALTHAGDYLANSNPEDLKAMFVDAEDVFQLTKHLEVSAKYNGISRYSKETDKAQES